MTQEEHDELRAMIEEIRGGDVRLGKVLHSLLDHVAPLHGVGLAPVEEAPEDVPSPIPARASRRAQL